MYLERIQINLRSRIFQMDQMSNRLLFIEFETRGKYCKTFWPQPATYVYITA